MPREGAEGGEKTSPAKDRPRGTRKKRFLKPNSGSARGSRGGRGKDVARLIRIAYRGRAKKHS
eukprot:5404102-Karenia_brevis.AAC.1